MGTYRKYNLHKIEQESQLLQIDHPGILLSLDKYVKENHANNHSLELGDLLSQLTQADIEISNPEIAIGVLMNQDQYSYVLIRPDLCHKVVISRTSQTSNKHINDKIKSLQTENNLQSNA